jgi:hypothetical protein
MQFQQQKGWQVIPPTETGRGWPEISVHLIWNGRKVRVLLRNQLGRFPGNKATYQPLVPLESEGINGKAIWVEVSHAASVHAGPAVSAPTVRFYRVGTVLHLLGYEQGWFQVSDPTTSQQGWVYEIYLEAIGAPDQVGATAQEPQRSARAGFQSPKPRRSARGQPSARAKNQQQSAEGALPSIQNEGVASLLERAFRGY